MVARFRVTPAMLYKAQRDVMRQIPWMHWGGYFVVEARCARLHCQSCS
jgi:hypothetical protein